MPHATLLTPNRQELALLNNRDQDLNAGAYSLIDSGCQAVLVTDTNEDSDNIQAALFRRDTARSEFSVRRIAGEFHGTGCTLASAIMSRLARNVPLEQAVGGAMQYTWECVTQAHLLNSAQARPNHIPSGRNKT